MDHRQNHNATHQTDCVPALLPILIPIKHDKVDWVVPNHCRYFKCNTVLAQIGRSFAVAPFKLRFYSNFLRTVCTIL